MDTYQFSQVYPATAVWPSPGSTFVATADADSVSIRLTSSLEQVRSWVCEAGDFSSRWCIDTLQWSPSGARILAHSSKLASAWVFDLTGDEANCRLRGVDKVEWGGEDVVSWSDRGMSLHDLSSGTSRFIQNVQSAPTWSPNGRYFAVIERHHGKDYIGVYDKSALVRHFPIPLAETVGILWSPCGKFIAVWAWRLTYSLYVFSPVGVQLGHYESDSDTLGGIERVTWSQDGLLAIGDSEGCVRLLESESWSPIATLRVRDSTAWRESTTATTRSGPRFTHFVRGTLSASHGPISFLQFNPEGSLLYLGYDRVLQIYDLQRDSGDGSLRIDVLSSVVFSNPIRTVQWCPSAERLAAVTRTRTVHFWDRLGVEGVDIPEGQDLLAMDVKWAPDGRCAVICGKQSFCMVYDDGPETAASMWEEVR